MLRKYENESEIYDLLRSFETGTISREGWRHAEHMVVALCYLRNHSLDEVGLAAVRASDETDDRNRHKVLSH